MLGLPFPFVYLKLDSAVERSNIHRQYAKYRFRLIYSKSSDFPSAVNGNNRALALRARINQLNLDTVCSFCHEPATIILYIVIANTRFSDSRQSSENITRMPRVQYNSEFSTIAITFGPSDSKLKKRIYIFF